MLVVLFWAVVALMYATQVALGPRPANEPGMLRTQLTWQTTYYLAWAPLTLLVWRITRTWDIERIGWRSFLARHAAFGTAVAIGQAALVFSIVWNFVPPPAMERMPNMLVTYVRTRLHTQFLIYASIVAAGQAIAFHNHYRERQVAAARLEAQLAAARLDTLRAQLQPHFLFNSLHSIASLARAGDTAGVVRLISGFSDLLRHLLDSRLTHHSVRDELSLVDRYLEIQRVRFGDRLQVVIDATPEATAARIPLLIVQPLVENALRHGLAPRIETGHLQVHAAREGNALQITVEDDGAGLPDGWKLGDSGTGLRNLASRLSVEFGDRQSVSVAPRDAGGVTAVVRIPYVRT